MITYRIVKTSVFYKYIKSKNTYKISYDLEHDFSKLERTDFKSYEAAQSTIQSDVVESFDRQKMFNTPGFYEHHPSGNLFTYYIKYKKKNGDIDKTYRIIKYNIIEIVWEDNPFNVIK